MAITDTVENGLAELYKKWHGSIVTIKQRVDFNGDLFFCYITIKIDDHAYRSPGDILAITEVCGVGVSELYKTAYDSAMRQALEMVSMWVPS